MSNTGQVSVMGGIIDLRVLIVMSGITLLPAATASGDTDRADGPGPAVRVEQWPVVESAVRPDPDIEARIEAILQRMTVAAKVGQVIQADLASVTPDDVRRYRLGSVLNGGNSAPGGQQYATAADWLATADAFYRASVDPVGDEPVIPLIWGTDAVHGHNNVIGATLFPHNIGLGAARDPDLVRRISAITAREVAATGLDWTFAPTLAVVRDDRWGRAYEGYSEDPEIVRRYAAAVVSGLQGMPDDGNFMAADKVVATAKHFLGDGGTLDGRDQGDNQSSDADLRAIHGAGYPPALAAGAQTVMASFSSWHGRKMHGNKLLLTDVLKQRMGFDGFVVGDWNGHGQVAGCTNTSCPQGFNAGIDMFMAPDSWRGLYDATLAQVRAGEISHQRLDDAVRRILRVKMRAGLFERGAPSQRPLAGRFELIGAPEHRAVARQAVRQSLVLLKNNAGLLPLAPALTVLVAGDGADDIAKQSGGWTLSWQGDGLDKSLFPGATSIFDGIRQAVEGAGGSAVLSADGSYTQRPDVAIVVYGEDPYAEFYGDVPHLAYRPDDRRDLALLHRLKADGIPTVSVFLSGRPLWVNPEINASDAFVAAWLPGSEGGGIADVLFRAADGTVAHDFTGTLSFSWPRTAVQPPQNRGDDGYDPLFAYGFGLSYGDPGDLDPLSEDSGLSDRLGQGAHAYLANGHAVAPWRLFVTEQDGAREEVLSARGQGSRGIVRFETTDRCAQEDTRSISWSGQGDAAVLLTGGTADLGGQADQAATLAVDFRLDVPPTGSVQLGMACGSQCWGTVDISAALRQAPVGEWNTLSVPLACFRQAGADLSRIEAPFMLSTAGRLGVSLSSIRLTDAGQSAIDCPD